MTTFEERIDRIWAARGLPEPKPEKMLHWDEDPRTRTEGDVGWVLFNEVFDYLRSDDLTRSPEGVGMMCCDGHPVFGFWVKGAVIHVGCTAGVHKFTSLEDAYEHMADLWVIERQCERQQPELALT